MAIKKICGPSVLDMSSLRSVEGHSALPLFSFEFRATQSINTKAYFFLLAGLVMDDGIKKEGIY